MITTWNLAHVDDESDLTELSSDDEGVDSVPTPNQVEPPRQTKTSSSSTFEISRKTTRPSTQEATQKSKSRPKDKWPRPAVDAHKTISFTAKGLYELIKKGKIDLNPEYQRGIVWNEMKQSNFINSLYHCFHAPEIVFNVTHDPDTGSKLKTCMDGKQRLTSICNFFDGKIPLMPYLSPTDAPGYARRKFWAKKIGSATRPLVPPHVMDNLEAASIACVEYLNLSPDLEREIFQRVQHGVPLTPSDRLPAINGPWADVVRELRNRMNTTEGFEGYLDWGKARGKDFQALTQIVYLAVNGKSPKKAFPSSLRIETFLNSTDEKLSSTKNSIINTMDIYCRIATTPGINEPLTTNLSPLEFVMAAFLILQQRSSLTDHQLSISICKMREHAQQRTEDMKFSQPNFKIFSDFVLKNLPKLVNQLLTTNGNEKPAACTAYKDRRENVVDRFKYSTETAGKSTPFISRGEKSSGKRNRGTEADDKDEDEDEDWIVDAPALKSRKKESSPTTKVEPLSKVVNRQRDAESKARTIVKKTPQKSITRSPVIKTLPPPKLASSKIDGQVGRPSIRPTPSMALQQASGSALPQSRRLSVLSTLEPIPRYQAGRPLPSRARDSQFLKARVSDSRTTGQEAVGGGIPPSSSTDLFGDGLSYGPSHQPQDQAHGRPKLADDFSTRNLGTARASPNVGVSIPPTAPVINKRHGDMAPETRRAYPSTDVNRTRDPRASLQSPGPISNRGSPLEYH